MPLTDLNAQSKRRTPDELISHLKSFQLELKFSAGIWFFSPPASRFHDKYKADLNLEQRLEIAASLKQYGLAGLEAHYPNEVNRENLHIWQKFANDTGIRLITVIPLLFYDKQFEFGSLSNPIAEARRAAVERAKQAFQLANEIAADFSVIWAGIDGYENPFGIDFIDMRQRFAEGIAEAMDAAPGVRIAFEPKPYEPRGHILYGLTPEGILLGHQVEAMLKNEKNLELLQQGHKLFCMNPERMPVDVALKNSMDALRAANDRINELDHARIIEATIKPDQKRGWIEAYLIRARAPHPDRLPPLEQAVHSNS